MDNDVSDKPLILVVEDEPSQLRRLVRILEPHYTVLSAQNGEEAIEIYRNHYDGLAALILDIRLPDKSAFDLLNTFEKICFTGVPPTIIQTAFHDTEWIQTMLGEYRALHYIVKPYEDEQILSAVKQVLNSDPFVFKWEQVKERLDIMSGLSQLRGSLYHEVSCMPDTEKDKWMPQIMELFHLYGEESLFSSNTDFKLKTTLAPVFTLAKELLNLSIPKPTQFKIGVLHGEGEKRVQDILNIPIQTDPTLLIAEPTFEVVRLSSLFDETQSCDFIVLDLDLPDMTFEEIQIFSQSSISQLKRPYLVVLTHEKDHQKLELAMHHGATFGFLQANTVHGHIKNSLIKFANRRYEISTLETMLKPNL